MAQAEERRITRNLEVEGVEILGGSFKNFSGLPDDFDPIGKRTFAFVIDDSQQAERLADDGWPIRALQAREEGDEPTFFMKVKINFKNRRNKPRVYKVTSRNTLLLDEEDVGDLDSLDIQEADLILSPYHYDVNGNRGVTAYLEEGYFVLRENRFSKKYLDRSQSEDISDDDIPFD